MFVLPKSGVEAEVFTRLAGLDDQGRRSEAYWAAAENALGSLSGVGRVGCGVLVEDLVGVVVVVVEVTAVLLRGGGTGGGCFDRAGWAEVVSTDVAGRRKFVDGRLL